MSSHQPTVASVNRGYYPALDGFRAIAVLMVFSVHYFGNKLPILGNWGWIGVDLFFVLSGFLITGILYDSRDREHRFRDFYARRILRIFPLYYGVWIALIALSSVFHWDWNREWLLWPMHLGNMARFIFFNPNNVTHLDLLPATRHLRVVEHAYVGHFWSLCIEEQFYLIWPAIVLCVRKRGALITICSTVCLGEPLLRMYLYDHLPAYLIFNGFLIRFTVTRLDSLMLGGLLALVLRGPQANLLHRFGRPVTLASISIFAGFVAEYVHRTHSRFAEPNDRITSTIGLSTYALLAAGVILELVRERSLCGRILQYKPLRKLGQISYGFYVFHDIPHDFYNYLSDHFVLRSSPTSPYLAAAFALLGTVAISILSFRYFEQPLLRFKSRFSAQTHTAPRS